MPATEMFGNRAKRTACILAATVALLALAISAAAAQVGDNPPPRDPTVEDAIRERLGQRSPEAGLSFAAATESLDEGDLQAAEAGFERVLELVPRSPDASRRLSQVLLSKGEFAGARRRAYAAYGYDPSPSNVAAVAEALLAFEDGALGGGALTVARAAALLLPGESDAQLLYVRAAIVSRDLEEVRSACQRAGSAANDSASYALFCNAFSLSDTGQWNEAEAQLNRARELGLPDEDVEWALDTDIRRRADFERRLYMVAWIMVGYVAAPLVLLGAGVGLGRMTLAVARRSAQLGEMRLTVPERFMHGAYRVVVLLTSAYYYASIPLLWMALVAAWIGAFLQAYAGQPLWLRIAVILGLVTVQYSLAVVYIGLTARVRHPEPGRPLARVEAPGIWRVVEDLAGRMDTRPIDKIYAIPEGRISVQEEGRTRDLLRGKGQRSLVLGLGLMPEMSERQLAAVVAHEYAHFTNHDTAGGQVARQVHASMQRIAVQLTMVGQNKWYSPGWWYASGYSRIFLLVTMGASRLHEILADRTAARTCGVGDFTSALRHIVRQDHVFSAQVRAEMRLAKEEGRPVANLYTLPPIAVGDESKELHARIGSAMRRPTSRFDTHLSTGERIDLLARFSTAEAIADDSDPVWALFRDPSDLQAEMTDLIRATVRRREDRLLRAVAEAHDEQSGKLRTWVRRATWFWRADRRKGSGNQ